MTAPENDEVNPAGIARMDKAHAATFTMAMLEEASSECTIEVADGCYVETDGVCAHGHESPMMVLGFI